MCARGFGVGDGVCGGAGGRPCCASLGLSEPLGRMLGGVRGVRVVLDHAHESDDGA